MKEQEYPKVYLYRRMVQAKLFIDTHSHQQIDLDNIADEASFSKFHFIRLFKKIYQLTPHQYLTYVRIKKARAMLEENNAVSAVCFDVGFESVTSFASLFKSLTGFSPSDYQRYHQRKNAALKTSPLTFIPHCYAEKRGWIKKSNFEEAV